MNFGCVTPYVAERERMREEVADGEACGVRERRKEQKRAKATKGVVSVMVCSKIVTFAS